MLDANREAQVRDVLASYLAQQPKDSLFSADNYQFIAALVSNCNDPYFYILEQYKVRKMTMADLIKIGRAYDNALRNCIDQAISNKDNILFEKVIDIFSRDPNNMSVEFTIMKLRMTYYKQTKQDSLYLFWLNTHLAKWMGPSDDSLLNVARVAYYKLVKKENRTDANEAEFTRKWIMGDKETMSINLNENAWSIYK